MRLNHLRQRDLRLSMIGHSRHLGTVVKILIITTGGTIDKIYFDRLSEYEVGEPQVATVLRGIHAAFDWEVDSLFRKDSLALTDEDRQVIRKRVEAADCGHILITHGTDTLSETGMALAGIPDKTIVLTGSLAPAIFKESDAVFNIGFALASVQLLEPGVYLAMNGGVFDPAKVRKNRELGLFEPTSSC